MAERLHAGNQWTDSGLVFTTEFGAPVDPRNLLRAVEIAAENAGIHNIGVHTLRHSAAVAWLDTSKESPHNSCSSTAQAPCSRASAGASGI